MIIVYAITDYLFPSDIIINHNSFLNDTLLGKISTNKINVNIPKQTIPFLIVFELNFKIESCRML